VGLVGTGEQPFWVSVVMLGCTQAVGFLLHVISLERGMRITEQEKMHIYIHTPVQNCVSTSSIRDGIVYNSQKTLNIKGISNKTEKRSSLD
jgi:hypothetical protein